MSPEPRHHATAYGLRWASDVPLVQFAAADAMPAGAPDVTVECVTALPPRTPLRPVRAGAVFADGTRFPWRREAVFDMIDGRRVACLPGPTWDGMPHAFYGTVVAHLLAWRGIVPFHACAVEIDGRGVLIAGTAGAGKSSLAAGLVGAGAALISDDLSAVAPDAAGGAALLPGRTTIRLDPQVAAWSPGAVLDLPARDRNGKRVLCPPVSRNASVPLAGMIALGLSPGPLAPLDRARFLARHLFRPAWLAAMPNHHARQRALLLLAAQLPVHGFAAIAGGGEAAHRDRAQAALALARAL